MKHDIDPRMIERLRTEEIIWLTTVDSAGSPQPRPVWFVWDGVTVLIYSHAHSRKLAHIARNARVSLNFNTNDEGYDVHVMLGIARPDATAPPAHRHAGYMAKYARGIESISMSPPQYASTFSAAIRITPVRTRGLEPLPSIIN